jgi:hypothetical protein
LGACRRWISTLLNLDQVSTTTNTSTAAPSAPETAPVAADYVVDHRGCWIWIRAVNGTGYAEERGGPDRGRSAARIYFERKHGPLPPEVLLDHCAHSRLCVNPDCQTPYPRSELRRRNAARWLDCDIVGEIRRRHAEGAIPARLAADLGLNYSTTRDALAGRTWGDHLG